MGVGVLVLGVPEGAGNLLVCGTWAGVGCLLMLMLGAGDSAGVGYLLVLVLGTCRHWVSDGASTGCLMVTVLVAGASAGYCWCWCWLAVAVWYLLARLLGAGVGELRMLGVRVGADAWVPVRVQGIWSAVTLSAGVGGLWVPVQEDGCVQGRRCWRTGTHLAPLGAGWFCLGCVVSPQVLVSAWAWQRCGQWAARTGGVGVHPRTGWR